MYAQFRRFNFVNYSDNERVSTVYHPISAIFGIRMNIRTFNSSYECVVLSWRFYYIVSHNKYDTPLNMNLSTTC
jgi:hypothetical protein